MTIEQYDLLIKYASDFRSALYAYEQENGVIDLKADCISEIVAAGANLIRLVDSLEPVLSPHDEAHF